MSPTQITRHLGRTGVVVIALNDLVSLREAARQLTARLPVRWSFEPGTPSTVVDYLAGGVLGAVEGAAVGLGVEVMVATLCPGLAFGYALAGGALLGATRGFASAGQGWRVRVVDLGYGPPLLEVRRVA